MILTYRTQRFQADGLSNAPRKAATTPDCVPLVCLASAAPIAHPITSVPFPFMPDRTSGSRRLVPIGAAVERSEMTPVRRFGSLDRHRADRPLDPTAMKGPGLSIEQTTGRLVTDLGIHCQPPLLTLNVSAMPTLRVKEITNIFVRGKGTQVPTMAQRDSEPQLIATTLDELTSDVTRKLGEDGLLDEVDMRIIRGLKVLTFRQARQAEVFDLTTSINRVGFTPRNIRRLRDMNPDAFGPECA